MGIAEILAAKKKAEERKEESIFEEDILEDEIPYIVALTQHFERFAQARTVCPCAAHLILEDLLASGLGQGFTLQLKVLILRGNARITD